VEPLPDWLKLRLARASVAPPRRVVLDPSAEEPPDETGLARAHERFAGLPRDLEPMESERGSFALRRTWLETSDAHGAWKLDEVDHCSDGVFAALTGDRALATLRAREAVFLDIETTGLSGGAGTHVFLVGLGWFEGERFLVVQGFLRGPEEEAALLAHCAERLAGARAVVSFFGKSFDRHRLEDKMRLHGIPPPFGALPHLDLYYPCRKLYGPALPDGRLATVERALCGVERAHDLPGSFAPEAWFDFLRGRAHLLEEVFRHNLHDVLSLVVLCAHVGRTSEESRGDGRPLPGGAHADAARARALAKLFAERKENELALTWLDRALERESDHARAREMRGRRAELLRKLGRRDEALAEALLVSEGGRDAPAAYAALEAARLLARAGHREQALALARRAIELAEVTLSGAKKVALVRSSGLLCARMAPRGAQPVQRAV